MGPSLSSGGVLLWALLFAFSVSAQELLERTDQRHDIIIAHGIQRSATGNWLVHGFENDEGGTGSHRFIRVLSPEGVEQAILGGGDDLESHPAGLVFSTYHSYCDLGSSGSYLNCSTESGMHLYSEEIVDPGGIDQGFWVHHIAQGSTDRLALIANDITALVSLNAQVLGAWATPIPSVKGALWTTTDSLLMWNASTMARIHATTGNYSIRPLSNGVKDVILRNDSVLVLTWEGIEVMNTGLSTLLALPIPASDTLLHFMPDGDALWIRSTTRAIELDAAFAPVGDFVFELLPAHRIVGALLEGDRIITSGDITHHGRRTGLLREYALDGSTTTRDADVELGLSVDSIRHPTASPNFFYFRATLTITNHGGSVVDEVFVHHQRGQSITCGIEGTSARFTGLDLQPGGTVTRVIPSVQVGPWFPPGGAAVWAEMLCMIALSPNSVVDRNMDDNYSCVAIDLDSVLATGIHGRGVQWVASLGPNPTSGRCTLRGLPPHSSGDLEIRDAIGRVLQSEFRAVGQDGAISIDLISYPAGRYLITFGSDTHRIRVVAVRVE